MVQSRSASEKGSVSGVLGLRMALALVVIAGVIILISARQVMFEAGFVKGVET
jgi:hypothetical protein